MCVCTQWVVPADIRPHSGVCRENDTAYTHTDTHIHCYDTCNHNEKEQIPPHRSPGLESFFLIRFRSRFTFDAPASPAADKQTCNVMSAMALKQPPESVDEGSNGKKMWVGGMT